MSEQIIDAHTLFGFWASRSVDISQPTLLKILSKHRVSRAATYSTAGLFFDFQRGNDESWQAAQERPGAIPVGTVDLRRSVGCSEEVRRRAEQGFRLFALFPETQDWSLDQVNLQPVLRAFQEVGAVLMVESAAGGGPSAAFRALGECGLPFILSGVNYRNLGEALEVLHLCPHSHLETHALTSVGAIKLSRGLVGPERLIFGSRSPLHYFSSAYLVVRYADLAQADRDLIMGGNLLRLLEGD